MIGMFFLSVFLPSYGAIHGFSPHMIFYSVSILNATSFVSVSSLSHGGLFILIRLKVWTNPPWSVHTTSFCVVSIYALCGYSSAGRWHLGPIQHVDHIWRLFRWANYCKHCRTGPLKHPPCRRWVWSLPRQTRKSWRSYLRQWKLCMGSPLAA